MWLAYPGPTSEITNVIAQDSFLDALDNNVFRVRTLEKELPALDTTLKIAVRLEAFDGGHSNPD